VVSLRFFYQTVHATCSAHSPSCLCLCFGIGLPLGLLFILSSPLCSWYNKCRILSHNDNEKLQLWDITQLICNIYIYIYRVFHDFRA
jgi:hypothetical protein